MCSTSKLTGYSQEPRYHNPSFCCATTASISHALDTQALIQWVCVSQGVRDRLSHNNTKQQPHIQHPYEQLINTCPLLPVLGKELEGLRDATFLFQQHDTPLRMMTTQQHDTPVLLLTFSMTRYQLSNFQTPLTHTHLGPYSEQELPLLVIKHAHTHPPFTHYTTNTHQLSHPPHPPEFTPFFFSISFMHTT